MGSVGSNPTPTATQCPISSVIEQPFCNRQVGGLNPSLGTTV